MEARDVTSPRAGITGSCELPDVSAGNSSLQEQYMLLIFGPSLQLRTTALKTTFYFKNWITVHSLG